MPKGKVKNPGMSKKGDIPGNSIKRITVRFERYPEIWELLINNAYDNCRSLNDEIIYCVKEQYKFEYEVKEWEGKL